MRVCKLRHFVFTVLEMKSSHCSEYEYVIDLFGIEEGYSAIIGIFHLHKVITII